MSIGAVMRCLWLGGSLVLFAIGAVATRLVLLPMLYLVVRERSRRERVVRTVVRRLLELFVRILEAGGLLRVRYERGGALPAERSILLANHPSLLDAVLLLANVPDVVCVAKGSLLATPVLGPIARAAGFISNADMELIMRSGESALLEGVRLLIFPEGTRSAAGGQIGPLSPIGFGLALRTKTPVVPVVISCVPPCLFKGQRFRELVGRRFEFTVTLCDPWGPFDSVGTVAEQRLVRAEKTRQLQHFFEERLFGRLSGRLYGGATTARARDREVHRRHVGAR